MPNSKVKRTPDEMRLIRSENLRLAREVKMTRLENRRLEEAEEQGSARQSQAAWSPAGHPPPPPPLPIEQATASGWSGSAELALPGGFANSSSSGALPLAVQPGRVLRGGSGSSALGGCALCFRPLEGFAVECAKCSARCCTVSCAAEWHDSYGATGQFLCALCWQGAWLSGELADQDLARRRQRARAALTIHGQGLASAVVAGAEGVGALAGGVVGAGVRSAAALSRGVVSGARAVLEATAPTRRQGDGALEAAEIGSSEEDPERAALCAAAYGDAEEPEAVSATSGGESGIRAGKAALSKALGEEAPAAADLPAYVGMPRSFGPPQSEALGAGARASGAEESSATAGAEADNEVENTQVLESPPGADEVPWPRGPRLRNRQKGPPRFGASLPPGVSCRVSAGGGVGASGVRLSPAFAAGPLGADRGCGEQCRGGCAEAPSGAQGAGGPPGGGGGPPRRAGPSGGPGAFGGQGAGAPNGRRNAGGLGGAGPPPPPPPGPQGVTTEPEPEDEVRRLLREQLAAMRRMLEEGQRRETAQGERLAALETQLKESGGHNRRAGGEEGSRWSDRRQNIRVKAEVEWPSYDGTDVYYDIDDFFRDLKRVMMLASGGGGYPPQERLEMLRGGLKGMPLLDFKTYVDDSEARTTILETGSAAEREALWEEVEGYIRKTHHRPLLERQRRARAEYQACSMRDGGFVDYPSFQAEFRKCVKNLERAKLTKPPEELKVDFLEKVTEECATHLMLTPWRDDATGESHMVRSVEEAQSMARDFFAIKATQSHVFSAEEVNLVRPGGQRKDTRKGGGKGKDADGVRRCRGCNGVGHLLANCPSATAAARGQESKDLQCSTCAGKGHSARDHGKQGNNAGEEVAAQHPQHGGGKGGGKGAQTRTKPPCWSFRDTGTCRRGDSCRYGHAEPQQHQGQPPGGQHACGECAGCFRTEEALAQHRAMKHPSGKPRPAGRQYEQASAGQGTSSVAQRTSPGGGNFAVEECDGGAELVAQTVEEDVAATQALSRPAGFKRFTEIGNIGRRRRPPLGKNHKMDVKLGRLKVRVVKDTGASVTTIPERLALKVINAHLDMDPNADDYPVGELFEYDEPVRLLGFAASKTIEIRFGCILFVTFLGVDGKSSTVPVEFRVVPDELDSSGLALLSASTVGPEGLDIRTTRAHHVVGRLGLSCARAELEQGRRGLACTTAQLPAEENLWLRCVGHEVYIPEGQCGLVKVSRPPRGMRKGVWVEGSSLEEVMSGCPGLADIDEEGETDVPSVVSGPLELDSESEGEGEESLTVLVRAAQSEPLALAPGEVVCRVTPRREDQEEVAEIMDGAAPEEDAEEVCEVLFDGSPPTVWSDGRLKEFYEDLKRREPEADREVAWHLAHLASLYAAGAESGLSFKHVKSQILQHQLKLLGTITGRAGLEPDPEKVKALQVFPEPTSKGQLREFFGTINWLRPFLAERFAEVSAPLRKMLKKKVPEDFGKLGEEESRSFKGLVALAVNHVKLAVPDYEAALKGNGAYFQIFLDASLMGVGALLCQADDAGRVKVLAVMSKSLTPTQQAWPAWVRELWGLKEAVLEFGPVCAGYPTVAWTDHNNNTKISLIPPEQCGEKIIRWWATIKQSGVEPRFLAGKVNPSDGLSRNPADRDERAKEREELLRQPALLEKAFDRAEFEDEPKELLSGEVLACLVGGDGAEIEEPLVDYVLDNEVSRVVRCLVVPAWEATSAASSRQEMEGLFVGTGTETPVVPMTFDVEAATLPLMDDEGNGAWFMLKGGGSAEAQRKALRNQLLTSLVELLRQLLRRRATVILGHGQGGVLVGLACCKAVRETAYRTRFVKEAEVTELEAAVARVGQVFLVCPQVALKPGGFKRVCEAVPEFGKVLDQWIQLELGSGGASDDGRLMSEYLPEAKVMRRTGPRRPLGPYEVKEPPLEEVRLTRPPRGGEGQVVVINFGVAEPDAVAFASAQVSVGGPVREIFAGSAVMTAMWRQAGLMVAEPYDKSYDEKQDFVGDGELWDWLSEASMDLVWLAPPCGKLSIARTTAKIPVRRSAEEPWAHEGDPDGIAADVVMNRAWEACEVLDDRGVKFVLETPWSCYSLKLASAKRVLGRKGVTKVLVCYCRLGRPYKKATALVTNWPALAELECNCRCGSRHAVVLEFKGTTAAAEYPELLCVGVTRLMLREGVGCPRGTKPPRWMPRLPWLNAYMEEVRLVGQSTMQPMLSTAVAGSSEGDEPCVSMALRSVRPALLLAQRKDPWCDRMLRILRWMDGSAAMETQGLLPADVGKLKRQAVEFEVAVDGVLQKRLSGLDAARTVSLGAITSVPVLPKAGRVPDTLAPEGGGEEWTWRRWALFQAHSSLPGGHLKFEKALPRLAAAAWWESMSKDLADWCGACVTCLKDRVPRKVSLNRSEHVQVPFDTVQIDLQGPIVPPSEEGWRFVLTAICVYTRYPSLRGSCTKTKQEVARVLVDIFWEVGTFPRVVMSDRGTEFVNELLEEVLGVLRVSRYSAPAYTPRVMGMVERSHRTMAAVLRALVSHFIATHRQRWGKFLLCVQYHLRHLQFASSSVTPFMMVHAWAAASPMQRALTPWSLVPRALPETEWVRELTQTWRTITERFGKYLKDYEAAMCERRDANAKWVTYVAGEVVMLERPPTVGEPSRVLMERMEGPYRVKKVLSDYRVVLEEMTGGATVPKRGGEAGVATSRLLKVPAGCWEPLSLEDAPRPPVDAVLSEDARRAWAQLAPGDFVLWKEDSKYLLGQVRANYPRRLVVLLAVFRLSGASWRRAYLSADGREVQDATGREITQEVAYPQLLCKTRLNEKDELEPPARRKVEALRLSPQRWGPDVPGVDPEPGLDAEAVAAQMPTGGEEAGYPVVKGVLVDGKLTDVVPKPMTQAEKDAVAGDEVVFSLEDRGGLRYAEVVAYETWRMARANLLLTEPDRHLMVFTCVQFRQAIWIDGASYSRLKGAVYDIDVGDAQPIAQQPYRKSPAETENCEWHLQKAVAMGILRPHVGSWATPAFVVKQSGKPRGRLVCDYRRVNAVTRRMYHPMPRVDSTLRNSAGARWYSGLDAVSGFNHLNLSERAKEVLAICSASGLYAWESLPFGPADGPQAFQAAMRRMFQGQRGLAIYLDDLCLTTGKEPAC